MELEEVAKKYRVKPIRHAITVAEDDTIRVYITYVDKTETSLKFKSLQGAEQFKNILFLEPAPCRLCGKKPTKNSGMLTCTSCAVFVNNEETWNKLMREPPNVRQMVADLKEPLNICRRMILEGDDSQLVDSAIKALVKINQLDLTDYYVRAADARSAEVNLTGRTQDKKGDVQAT